MGVVPEAVYCDTFEFGELKGAVNERWPLVKRRTRWSESTERYFRISSVRQRWSDVHSAGVGRVGAVGHIPGDGIQRSAGVGPPTEETP